MIPTGEIHFILAGVTLLCTWVSDRHTTMILIYMTLTILILDIITDCMVAIMEDFTEDCSEDIMALAGYMGFTEDIIPITTVAFLK